MIQLTNLLLEIFNKKEGLNIKQFLDQFPSKASWYLVSDYCIDDSKKANDAFTFSLILNHDKYDNIKDFINNIAPKDIKNTKTISDGIISYINSPVTYHFSIVIPRKEKLLSGLINKDEIREIIKRFDNILENSKKADISRFDYFNSIQERVKMIKSDLNRNNFNEKLMRKIFLTTSLGASIIYMMKKFSSPTHIGWISDRDAIIEKYDGFVFDYMFMCYKIVSINKEFAKIDPEFKFIEPEKTGKNFYDELIRIPDYITGTLASIDIENADKSKELHEKHIKMLTDTLLDPINQATIKLEYKNNTLSAYNFKWVSDSNINFF